MTYRLLSLRLLLLFIGLMSFMTPNGAIAQTLTKIMGTVIDAETKEPVPFVNIFFPSTQIQTTTDFEGRFSIETKTAGDSLRAQYMGYVSLTKAVVKNKFQYIDFELKPLSFDLREVVIVAGENPAEIILKKVIRNKELNNREKYLSFNYSAYSKIQIDANNFSSKLKDRAIMRPFRFIFDNVDTSVINGKAYLPVFLTETLSDVYFRGNPATYREIIRASIISGTRNKSMSQLIGDSYQRINIYDNYHDLFQKNFVSPVANFGLAYYRYYLIDSGFVDNNWCYHIMFKPRRSQELTYTGNFWVHDTTFGIKKVDMRITGDANINIFNEILVYQEHQLTEGKYWMPRLEKLVADMNISENNERTMGLYVHKFSSYQNISVNRPADDKIFKNPHDIIVSDSAYLYDEDFWESQRHETLSVQERAIYKMADTIQTLPAFRFYKNLLVMFSTGYIKAGYLEIGPIFSTYSYNEVEGSRFRLGLRTSNDFSKTWMIDAHAAYGVNDEIFKYGGGFYHLFRKNPNRAIGASFKYEIEQLGASGSALREDFIIGSVARRNSYNKLTYAREIKGFYEHEWFMGFSTKLFLIHRSIWPLTGTAFMLWTGDAYRKKDFLTTSEIKLNIHLAIKEKYVTGEFERVSLGTKYPVFDLAYTYGLKGAAGGDFGYHKLQLGLNQWYSLGILGWSKYIVEAGKIWGTLPYPLLKLHEGNETWIYDEPANNAMNYYEFASDEWLSLHYAHHFDGLLFNKIPLLKKLRWRETAYGRALFGHMGEGNRSYSIFPETLSAMNKPYFEAGAGIENIFTIFKVMAVWRLSHTDKPDVSRFGIMGSMYFSF
jgi:hypothetical protein